ncbi:MAG: TonB-dependent receptor plug domain-containing protein, partial [Bacteroidota bacterium]|nr:TonB-dependent receptor plug domain-containing protein [Bacteroidota bacterium]
MLRALWLGLCLTGSAATTIHCALPSDSLLWDWVSLDSASIATFSPLLSPEQIAATRWTTDSTLTNGFGSADVSNALNALPGVLMETRGMGGSRRINVRGSALRSPFAVRNTMLFVRGFMLTEADGTSPVEWLDPAWSGGMELVSGAAATTFGGAYGGAMVVHGASNPELARLQTVMGTTGNSGLQSRVNGALQIQGWNLRVSHTQNSGYRDQEANNRLHLEVDHAWGNDNFKHYDWLAFQDGSWELPGAVDSLTAFTDATATLAPGLAYDAYVRRRRALWGHHIHVPNLSNKQHRSSLDVWSLLRWSDKTNPFGTSAFYNGYKEESGTGGSLRIRQRFGKWSFENVDFQAEWTLMAVVDQGNFAQWSDAVLGSESPLEYDLDIRQSRAHWAPALSWAWDSGWRLETSAAFSQRSRLAQGTAADTAYNSPFNTTQLLPRVGASKSLGSAWTAFVQASTGFSDPTN